MKAKAPLVLFGLLAGCLQGDPAYVPVTLQPPYSNLPDAPADARIEPGMPVRLDARQQEAVVTAVLKWMKRPDSVSFGPLSAVRSRRGPIVVCGEANGRNSAGDYPGMAPFVGVLMGTPAAPEFVLVSIAQSGAPRAEVQSICQQSGIF
ncbi:MAG TPA: hypothetical protein VLA02_00160 [Reyranella sp.]|nr:hypothetical protein [Reyranella sp.]